MTVDQIAAQTLHVQEIQAWITGVAIVLGPLAGVLFTLWVQSRREKRLARQQLFMVLMSERKGLAVSTEVTKALNRIDVVFADRPSIKALWHKYYALLSQQPGQERDHTWLEMLSAMAQDLGYGSLTQTDLDKFYIPQGHVDDADFNRKIAMQWLRVLESTERFVVESKKET